MLNALFNNVSVKNKESMTMRSILNNFESYLLTQKRVSSHTYIAYKKDLDQYTQFLEQKNVSGDSATTEVIKNFLEFLTESHLTPRTIARKISSLKAFYAWAKEKLEWDNVMINISFPKLEKRLPSYISEEDVEKLLIAAAQDASDLGVRNKIMLAVLYAGGLRVSELVSLRISDIQFETGFVKVTGKRGKERMVPLPIPLFPLLKGYLEGARKRLMSKSGKMYESDFLFPVLYGGKIKSITRQSFWIIIKSLWEGAGLKRSVSPHRLRHSLATHLLQKGADLRSLQLLLGHENISTVQVYTHLENEHLRNVYDKKHPRA
jgi:integrase/recombinase XerD